MPKLKLVAFLAAAATIQAQAAPQPFKPKLGHHSTLHEPEAQLLNSDGSYTTAKVRMRHGGGAHRRSHALQTLDVQLAALDAALERELFGIKLPDWLANKIPRWKNRKAAVSGAIAVASVTVCILAAASIVSGTAPIIVGGIGIAWGLYNLYHTYKDWKIRKAAGLNADGEWKDMMIGCFFLGVAVLTLGVIDASWGVVLSDLSNALNNWIGPLSAGQITDGIGAVMDGTDAESMRKATEADETARKEEMIKAAACMRNFAEAFQIGEAKRQAGVLHAPCENLPNQPLVCGADLYTLWSYCKKMEVTWNTWGVKLKKCEEEEDQLCQESFSWFDKEGTEHVVQTMTNEVKDELNAAAKAGNLQYEKKTLEQIMNDPEGGQLDPTELKVGNVPVK